MSEIKGKFTGEIKYTWKDEVGNKYTQTVLLKEKPMVVEAKNLVEATEKLFPEWSKKVKDKVRFDWCEDRGIKKLDTCNFKDKIWYNGEK